MTSQAHGDQSTTLLHDNGSAMHWKRILLLSLLGVGMGAASSFGLTRGQGFTLWIVLACCATGVLAQKVRKSIFLHGFVAGFLAGVLDGATKGILLSSYVVSNPEVASDLGRIPRSNRG